MWEIWIFFCWRGGLLFSVLKFIRRISAVLNSIKCGRNEAADLDVEFLSNLIRWIDFFKAEMQRMNRA